VFEFILPFVRALLSEGKIARLGVSDPAVEVDSRRAILRFQREELEDLKSVLMCDAV
jgi:hypothetical protein